MKNLSDIVLEKLNLGKAKINVTTDLETFANNHNVQIQHHSEGNRINDYIGINCEKILAQNKNDVDLFIDVWFSDSEYKKQYKFKRLFWKLKSDTHIYVQILSNKDIILGAITIYDHAIQVSYADNIDENIIELIYSFLDDIIAEFNNKKTK